MKKKPLDMRSIYESDMIRAKKEQEHYSHIDHDYDPVKYEEGTKAAKTGTSLDEVGELANNKSFLNGYARGLRLIKIEQISETPKMKR